ncbi:MAG: DUF2254 domain-containing protein [Planctomycetales bacterium]|nr:DUF2254 domain-containing protein [Planctomycetales bacterium]MBN8625314.1 DUF2254 domain-containing protein [Planctomycetota bacterium]
MRLIFLKYWEQVRTGFWFLPSLMALGALLASTVTVALDGAGVDRWLDARGWVYAGGAEGASAVLAAIAGAMITIAGVVFSLTLVALSQASSQFGPRLLRNFMRDTANQLVLGAFVSTFLYCLLVLRTIRRTDEGAFVPHLSVTIGVALAVVSIGVLIYFIHHVSVSIHADRLISRVHQELLASIDRLFPEEIGDEPPGSVNSEPQLPDSDDERFVAVPSPTDGYVQLIDADGLLRLTVERDLVVRILLRPGDYAVRRLPLLRVWPSERIDDDVRRALVGVFVFGDERTSPQDAGYPIAQLVEVALRALSPGINDPFTAITCIDRLTSALARLADRELPSPWRFDEERRPRIYAPAATFEGLLSASFRPIWEFGKGHALIVERLRHALDTLAAAGIGQDRQEQIRRFAKSISLSEV